MKKSPCKILFFCLLFSLIVSAFSLTATAEPEKETLEYFGKEMLSEDELYVYGLFEEKLLDGSGEIHKIDVPKEKMLTPDIATDVLEIFLGDHPECFWLANGMSYATVDGYVVEISPQYYVQGENLVNMKNALEERVSSIIQAMEKESFTSDYDKALYLHDAVASIVDYKKEGMHQTSMGALVYGYAVCSGYASAYQLLLNRVGIKAFTVSGDGIDPKSGKSEAHAWTLMEIDGECVYTDVTWDDQGESIYHAYFCISLEEMSKTHFASDSYTLPSCGHNGKDYFSIKGNTFADGDGIEAFKSLLTKTDDTKCVGAFLYKGEDFKAWMDANVLEIYSSLGGTGKISYTISSVDNEYFVEMTGDFSGAGLPDTPESTPIEIPTVDTSNIQVPDENDIFGPIIGENGGKGCFSSLSAHTIIIASVLACGLVLVLIRRKNVTE